MRSTIANTSIFAAITAVTLTFGCKDPAADKPAARVEPPQPVATAAPTPESTPEAVATTTANPAGLAIDTTASTIGFVGSKVTGSHNGGFNNFSGTIALGPDGQATGGSVLVLIQTNSIFADADRLTAHLKTDEFFDVEKFPTATFVSSSIVAGGEAGASHTITGALTMHGVEKTISFPASITVTDTVVAASAEFSINRQDFNLVYPGHADDLIRDQVVIKLEVAANR